MSEKCQDILLKLTRSVFNHFNPFHTCMEGFCLTPASSPLHVIETWPDEIGMVLSTGKYTNKNTCTLYVSICKNKKKL